jgi:hypothetical protein
MHDWATARVYAVLRNPGWTNALCVSPYAQPSAHISDLTSELDNIDIVPTVTGTLPTTFSSFNQSRVTLQVLVPPLLSSQMA